MKKVFFVLFFACITISGFSQVNWTTFENAMSLSKNDGKPLLIDVYTTWCGWCKRLDATTYQDSSVINYINTHFHAVKLDAEGHANITYKDSVYTNHGKTHDLAVKLLNGKMSYPTTIFMVPDADFYAPIPGYLTKESIQPYLFYFGDEVYKTTNTWESFIKGFNAKKF